jgi:hypothetical protein
MGRLVNGIYGPIVGKVGPVVGSSINGRPYIKVRRYKRTGVVSDKELANRQKFAVAQAWLRPLVNFVREGFKGYSPQAQGFVAAKSHLLKNALKGVAPDFYVDPSLVKLSYGNLELPENITVEKSGNTEITFTWDTRHGREATLCDQVMMVAYDIENQHSVDSAFGEFRHKGTATYKLAAGHAWHIWFAMNAHDRSRQSDSIYLGEISM